MHSHPRYSILERVPHDVLQHIALLSASPADLCRLLATSRVLYAGLNICTSPHLYAAIFRLTFDSSASASAPLTNSALAAELVQRCRALRRCRRLDLSVHGLRQDLWTLLWMVIETGPCVSLSEAGFSRFVVELARYYLRDDVWPWKELKNMVVWLLCLGLTRQDILSQTPEVRGTLLALLRPFVSADTSRVPVVTSPFPFPVFHAASSERSFSWPFSWSFVPADEEGEITRYNAHTRAPSLPPPTDAAIILTFALKEAVALQLPFHLPATRAIATAENRTGPTAEDYTAFQRTGTRLFADIRATAATNLNFLELDPWISHLLAAPGMHEPRLHCPVYPPGSLTGVWEGSLMISSCVSLANDMGSPEAPAAGPPDFLCRTPMQCKFSEYLCFSPCIPLPDGHTPVYANVEDSEAWGTFDATSGNFAYRKFTPGEEFQREFSRPALDHVLIGQTLHEHEDAWAPGGFNFAGRVKDDGLIAFTRRPKNDESEASETWLFEGHLRYGTALVGSFRSSSADDLCGIQGIFSLRKRE
ncbi:hypothetical protein DFH07DRAFT_175583 [Mycena maculata]|uniref:F-box domain-containing protein n=1 Tax=Mycena maculata TaxID=230809 RepID=A0AAD7HY29_9AGAR|nr:hypothetical protein DFH07DRAFT_175583 [Mycena maculata]